MEVAKQMILNLALLLVILFSYQAWNESRESEKQSAGMDFLFFFGSVFICLLLSVKINPEVRYDLRGVPLIIGGFYLGGRKGLFLFAAAVLARSFFGITDGFWTSVAIYGGQALLIFSLRGWFNRQRLKHKVLLCVLISIGSSLCFMGVMGILQHSLSTLDWAIYIISSVFGTAMMAAAIESYRRNSFLRWKVMQTEKIEAISQLAASISHEVRNPLTAVQGFLQLLKESSYGEEKRAEFVDIALHEVRRAEKIINDYLTFSKPSIDKLEKIDLENELLNAINIIQPFAHMNSIEIRNHLQPGLIIHGDISHFQQCVVNIIKNATEAMPEGGTLSLISYQNEKNACIQISDTGMGMSREQVLKLGEPYYSTKGAKGTGLGMMVTYGIVRAMKGNIQVDSIEGHGTSFHISFPAI